MIYPSVPQTPGVNSTSRIPIVLFPKIFQGSSFSISNLKIDLLLSLHFHPLRFSSIYSDLILSFLLLSHLLALHLVRRALLDFLYYSFSALLQGFHRNYSVYVIRARHSALEVHVDLWIECVCEEEMNAVRVEIWVAFRKRCGFECVSVF